MFALKKVYLFIYAASKYNPNDVTMTTILLYLSMHLNNMGLSIDSIIYGSTNHAGGYILVSVPKIFSLLYLPLPYFSSIS